MAELPVSSTAERSVLSILGKVTTLPLPSGVAIEDGTAVEVHSLHKLFQITGITTGTVHIDGSNDGETWVSLGNVTANGKIANAEAWKYVRARISAWTTGTFVVQMCE